MFNFLKFLDEQFVSCNNIEKTKENQELKIAEKAANVILDNTIKATETMLNEAKASTDTILSIAAASGAVLVAQVDREHQTK